MAGITATEVLLRRDRLIVAAGLILICLLSWLYIAGGAGTGMSTAAMSTWQFPPPVTMSNALAPWDSSYWIVMALMWWVMMIAMMVPSAAPTILLYARVYRHAQTRGQIGHTSIPTAAFVGVYQLSPLKSACLKHCRSPADFISRHWRAGRSGAALMGLEHGFYCVGCCWLLMVLLFVGGVMNLVWIAGLAIFVLLEKLAPYGTVIGRASGLLMIAAGGYLLLA